MAPVSKLTARHGDVQCRETHEAGPRALRYAARPRQGFSGGPGCIPKAGTPLTGGQSKIRQIKLLVYENYKL